MQVDLHDEAKDLAESYQVLSLAREKGSLLITTPKYTIMVGPFEEFAEAVVELVGLDDLPEPHRPRSQSSLEAALLDALYPDRHPQVT